MNKFLISLVIAMLISSSAVAANQSHKDEIDVLAWSWWVEQVFGL